MAGKINILRKVNDINFRLSVDLPIFNLNGPRRRPNTL
jgi:hypothetical protein